MSYNNYVKYKARYERGGCTIEQLQKLVSLNALTQDEYDLITDNTNEDYIQAGKILMGVEE